MTTSAFEIAQAVLLSVGGGSLVVLAMSSWLGKVWAARILEKDRQTYTQEMESIKQSNKTVANALGVASSTHSESLKIYAELRAKAISQLWKDFLRIKSATPLSLCFLDLMPNGKSVSQFLTSLGKSGVKEHFSVHKQLFFDLDSEGYSPYLDERHLDLLYLYRKAIFRIHYYYEEIELKNSPNEGTWRFDELLVAHFKLIFGEEELLKMQDSNWTTSYFMTFVEKNLITELRNALTGEKDSRAVLDEALANIKVVSQIRTLELSSDKRS